MILCSQLIERQINQQHVERVGDSKVESRLHIYVCAVDSFVRSVVYLSRELRRETII